MKCYLRFGHLPDHNISKKHRGDEIVKEEKGLSVWNCALVNDVPFPLLPENPTESCMADYFYMLLGDRPVYLVTGEELDEKGSAGEPLLTGSISIIKEYTEDYAYLKKIHTRNKENLAKPVKTEKMMMGPGTLYITFDKFLYDAVHEVEISCSNPNEPRVKLYKFDRQFEY